MTDPRLTLDEPVHITSETTPAGMSAGDEVYITLPISHQQSFGTIYRNVQILARCMNAKSVFILQGAWDSFNIFICR